MRSPVVAVALALILITLSAGCRRYSTAVDDPAVVLYRSGKPGVRSILGRDGGTWQEFLTEFHKAKPHKLDNWNRSGGEQVKAQSGPADAGLTATPAQPTPPATNQDQIAIDLDSDIRSYTRHYINLIEQYHQSYDTLLYFRVAGGRTLFDTTLIGLTFATTVVGGETSKAVIGAVATAVQGVELSLSENYLQNQTSIAIISQMKRNRDQQRTELETKLTGTQPLTSKEEADILLTRYFASGSLAQAVSTLVADTSERATEARAQLEAVTDPDRAAAESFRKRIVAWLNDSNVKEEALVTERRNTVVRFVTDKAPDILKPATLGNKKDYEVAITWLLDPARTPADLRTFVTLARIPNP